MRRLNFRKNQHLRKAPDFARVYARRCVARTAHLTVFAAPNQGHALRVGLSVSKKHGNAVLRNRLKRLMREAFRLSRHELPGGLDLVLVPVDARTTLSEFQKALVQSVQKLARRVVHDAARPKAGTTGDSQTPGEGGTTARPRGRQEIG